jgi:hypothetical protein
MQRKQLRGADQCDHFPSPKTGLNSSFSLPRSIR